MKKSLFVLALLALVASPALASAMSFPRSIDVDANAIVNINEASVNNEVSTSANTGANQAFENAGDVTVRTGNASAYSYTNNLVNYNDNFIYDGCGCDTPRRRALDVDANVIVNVNHAKVGNEVSTYANTGRNEVSDNGGYYYEETTVSDRTHFGGHGLYMMDVAYPGPGFYHYGSRHYYNHTVSFPTGGDVTVRTGNASARTDTVNTVNYNVNRIIRGTMQE